jgi:hypothetical protein
MVFSNMTSQMSITQGLAELKLLDKRLNKGLEDVIWMAVSTKNKKVSEEELKKTASAEYQSYLSLVKRRDTIKRAIVLSNASTPVSISTSWSGTVAEAIEYKSSLMYKKKLLAKMKECVLKAEEEFKDGVEEMNSRLDRLLSSELGKDVKTNPETIAALSASFQETNKVVLVDPLGLKAESKRLEEEIDAFETNVDWVLSECNGKTLISV